MDMKLYDSITSLEQFCKYCVITVCVNIDEYITGYKRKSRLILSILTKSILLINAIRFALSAVINKVGYIVLLMINHVNLSLIFKYYFSLIAHPLQGINIKFINKI